MVNCQNHLVYLGSLAVTHKRIMERAKAIVVVAVLTALNKAACTPQKNGKLPTESRKKAKPRMHLAALRPHTHLKMGKMEF